MFNFVSSTYCVRSLHLHYLIIVSGCVKNRLSNIIKGTCVNLELEFIKMQGNNLSNYNVSNEWYLLSG